jgi:plastocyanin
MTRKHITFPVVGIAAAAIAAGGIGVATSAASNHAPAPTAHAARSTTLRLTADPHGRLRFNTNHLTAHPGKVTIVLTNPRSAGMPHGIAIKGRGVNRSGKVVGPGGRSIVAVTLKRGTFTFFCPVPGHAAAGMTGTLTVR